MKNKIEATVKEPGRIVNTKSKDIFGMIFFKQKDIEKIYEDSGKNAIGNEFQVHYTALVGKQVIDDQEFYISIPLVYYNYKQEVSSTAIDFNLKDVEEISGLVEPLALQLASENIDKIPKDIRDRFEWKIQRYQSLHRHPGGSTQAFSGTDLDTKIEKPGIVFPYTEVNEPTPNFAGIMYVDSKDGKCKLAHNEIRVARSTEKSIVYEKGICYSYIYGYEHEPTRLEKLFGIKGLSMDNYFIEDGCDMGVPKNYVDAFKDMESEIEVEADNVKKKTYKAKTYLDGGNWGYGRQFSYKQGTLIPEEDYYEIEDDDDFDIFEVNNDFQYVWDPVSLNKKDREEYLRGLREELFLNYDGSTTLNEINKLNDVEVIKLCKIQGVLAPNLRKVKYADRKSGTKNTKKGKRV